MSNRPFVLCLAAPVLIAAATLTGCQQKEAPAPAVAETKPEPKPTPTPPASLPGLAMAGVPTEVAPGVFTWDLTPGNGGTLGADTRTVTVQLNGWTQDGTQYFGGTDGADTLVLGADNATAFPGWAEAIDGMRVGGTRKVWAAAPEDAPNWPVDGNEPLVLDIKLDAIDDNATFANLPGADIAAAAPQGGAGGLRFYDMTAGTGAGAQAGDAVAIRYEAWLADGTPLASATGEPVTITLDASVAPGIAQGLTGLSQGGTRKLVVPATIGMGFDPQSPFPTGSTVILDVEVVSVTPAATSTAQVD